jgi:hypothetical protein
MKESTRLKMEEVEKIKLQIKELSNKQEEIYSSLLASQGIDTDSHVEGWLFDYIFNDSEFSGQTLVDIWDDEAAV